MRCERDSTVGSGQVSAPVRRWGIQYLSLVLYRTAVLALQAVSVLLTHPDQNTQNERNAYMYGLCDIYLRLHLGNWVTRGAGLGGRGAVPTLVFLAVLAASLQHAGVAAI